MLTFSFKQVIFKTPCFPLFLFCSFIFLLIEEDGHRGGSCLFFKNNNIRVMLIVTLIPGLCLVAVSLLHRDGRAGSV